MLREKILTKIAGSLLLGLALTSTGGAASPSRVSWGAPDPVPSRALKPVAFPLYANMGMPNSTQWHFLKFTEKIRQTCEDKTRSSYSSKSFLTELNSSNQSEEVKLTCLWPFLIGELELTGTQLTQESPSENGIILTLAARLQNVDLLDGYQQKKIDSLSAYTRLLTALRLIRHVWPTVKETSNHWYSPGDAYWMSVVPSFNAWLSALSPWSYLMTYALSLDCSAQDQTSCGEQKKAILTSIYRAVAEVNADSRLSDVVFKFDQLKEAQTSKQLEFIREYTPVIRATMGLREKNLLAVFTDLRGGTRPVSFRDLYLYLTTDLGDYALEVTKSTPPSTDPCALLALVLTNLKAEPAFQAWSSKITDARPPEYAVRQPPKFWDRNPKVYRDRSCTSPFSTSAFAVGTMKQLINLDLVNRFAMYQARTILGVQALDMQSTSPDERKIGIAYRITLDIREVIDQLQLLISHREFVAPINRSIQNDENAEFLITHLKKVIN